MRVIVAVICVGLAGYHETGAVTLDGNGYNLVVAISDNIKTVTADQQETFLPPLTIPTLYGYLSSFHLKHFIINRAFSKQSNL